jgi:hypothetical protein
MGPGKEEWEALDGHDPTDGQNLQWPQGQEGWVSVLLTTKSRKSCSGIFVFVRTSPWWSRVASFSLLFLLAPDPESPTHSPLPLLQQG